MLIKADHRHRRSTQSATSRLGDSASRPRLGLSARDLAHHRDWPRARAPVVGGVSTRSRSLETTVIVTLAPSHCVTVTGSDDPTHSGTAHWHWQTTTETRKPGAPRAAAAASHGNTRRSRWSPEHIASVRPGHWHIRVTVTDRLNTSNTRRSR
jgi:hypothetical protein